MACTTRRRPAPCCRGLHPGGLLLLYGSVLAACAVATAAAARPAAADNHYSGRIADGDAFVGRSGMSRALLQTGCIPNPCANGGKCKPSMGSYKCTCTKQWKGTNCTEDVDECTPPAGKKAPCIHGTCINKSPGYVCACEAGWQGLKCEKDVNECLAANPCQNGGKCVNTKGGSKCKCAAGWSGDLCETAGSGGSSPPPRFQDTFDIGGQLFGLVSEIAIHRSGAKMVQTNVTVDGAVVMTVQCDPFTFEDVTVELPTSTPSGFQPFNVYRDFGRVPLPTATWTPRGGADLTKFLVRQMVAGIQAAVALQASPAAAADAGGLLATRSADDSRRQRAASSSVPRGLDALAQTKTPRGIPDWALPRAQIDGQDAASDVASDLASDSLEGPWSLVADEEGRAPASATAGVGTGGGQRRRLLAGALACQEAVDGRCQLPCCQALQSCYAAVPNGCSPLIWIVDICGGTYDTFDLKFGRFQINLNDAICTKMEEAVNHTECRACNNAALGCLSHSCVTVQDALAPPQCFDLSCSQHYSCPDESSCTPSFSNGFCCDCAKPPCSRCNGDRKCQMGESGTTCRACLPPEPEAPRPKRPTTPEEEKLPGLPPTVAFAWGECRKTKRPLTFHKEPCATSEILYPVAADTHITIEGLFQVPSSCAAAASDNTCYVYARHQSGENGWLPAGSRASSDHICGQKPPQGAPSAESYLDCCQAEEGDTTGYECTTGTNATFPVMSTLLAPLLYVKPQPCPAAPVSPVALANPIRPCTKVTYLSSKTLGDCSQYGGEAPPAGPLSCWAAVSYTPQGVTEPIVGWVLTLRMGPDDVVPISHDLCRNPFGWLPLENQDYRTSAEDACLKSEDCRFWPGACRECEQCVPNFDDKSVECRPMPGKGCGPGKTCQMDAHNVNVMCDVEQGFLGTSCGVTVGPAGSCETAASCPGDLGYKFLSDQDHCAAQSAEVQCCVASSYPVNASCSAGGQQGICSASCAAGYTAAGACPLGGALQCCVPAASPTYFENELLNSRIFGEALATGPAHKAWPYIVPFVMASLAQYAEMVRPSDDVFTDSEFARLQASYGVRAVIPIRTRDDLTISRGAAPTRGDTWDAYVQGAQFMHSRLELGNTPRPFAPYPPDYTLSCMGVEPRMDTEGAVIAAENFLLVVFRGSEIEREESLMADWVGTDLHALPVEVEGHKLASGFAHAYFDESTAAADGSRMPSARAQLSRAIRMLATPSRSKVYFAGFSLGGALAPLAAFDVHSNPPAPGVTVGGVFLFGAPQVGQGSFQAAYNQALYDRTYRIVHKTKHTDDEIAGSTSFDVITALPGETPCGYKHVGQLWVLQDTGGWKWELPVYSFSRSPQSEDSWPSLSLLKGHEAMCIDASISGADYAKAVRLALDDIERYMNATTAAGLPTDGAHLGTFEDHDKYVEGQALFAVTKFVSMKDVRMFFIKFFPDYVCPGIPGCPKQAARPAAAGVVAAGAPAAPAARRSAAATAALKGLTGTYWRMFEPTFRRVRVVYQDYETWLSNATNLGYWQPLPPSYH